MNNYTEAFLLSQLQHSIDTTTKLLELQKLTHNITKNTAPKNVDKAEPEAEKTIQGYKLDYVPTYDEFKLVFQRGKVELCQHWFKQTPMLLYKDFGTKLINRGCFHPKALAWLLKSKQFVWADIKNGVILSIHSIEFFNECPDLYILLEQEDRVALFKKMMNFFRTKYDDSKILCTMLFNTTPLILENLKDKTFLRHCMFNPCYNSYDEHIDASLFVQDLLGKDFIDNVLS